MEHNVPKITNANELEAKKKKKWTHHGVSDNLSLEKNTSNR